MARPPGLPEGLCTFRAHLSAALVLTDTNRQVAEELYISSGTAKRHVENITAKLGVSDRTQAVVRALQLGILEFSED
jgi:DNA-binding NarL/FixJ family response regulator